MTGKDFFHALGPWIKHGIVGGIVVLAIGFSTGWVATANAVDEAAHNARVAAYANVCADRALQFWREQGTDLTALNNFERRGEVDKFVERFMKDVGAVEGIEFDLEDACDGEIEEMI